MLLTYSFPKFKDLILSGQKIHTIRADPKKRWKPGMAIQHWLGSPRNVHAKEKPYEFGKGECKGVQEIYIQSTGIDFHGHRRVPNIEVWIGVFSTEARQPYTADGRWISDSEVGEIAKNDGLTLDEFREWFVPDNKHVFAGRIIHFTDKLY